MNEQQNIPNDIHEEQFSHEEQLAMELARMAGRRKSVPCPDVDAAWDALSAAMDGEHDSLSESEPWQAVQGTGTGKSRMGYFLSALLGAAAMLTAVIIYNKVWNPAPDVEQIIALSYDEKPQQVLLQQDEDKMTDITRRDSISFFVDKAVGTPEGKLAAPYRALDKPAGRKRLSTPRGMDFKVTLEDGTEVWLNAESTIEFPAAFTDNERRVQLRGEAFFRVARNENAPFIVESERVNVRVLGTEFNMKAYQSELPHVALVKGSVEIEGKGVVLKPGEDAWCDAEGQIHVRDIDTYAVTQWVEGFFYFDDQPLLDVLRELGRWYNLGVIFRHQAAMARKLHFSCDRHESIDQALADISRLLNIKLAISGTDIVVE